jgi:predicted short-subunit dehydrogenase-like oxidoreductase (DUF2520 family)
VIEVGLAGPGRVGRTLAALLPLERFRLGPVLSRTATSARRAVREMERGVAVTDCEAFATCNVIVVSVPDPELPVVVKRFAAARMSWSKKTVLHTSGLHPASVFETLRKRGAAAGSMHPLFVFQRPVLSLAGVHFTVEGDAAAASIARRLIRGWNGEFQLVKPEDKIYHSIARSLLSDFLTGLLEAAVQQMVAGGFSRKRAFHAVSQVLGMALEDYARSGRSSRPGPLLSGDVLTVRRQIEALQQVDAGMAETYRKAAWQTLRTLQNEAEGFAFLHKG